MKLLATMLALFALNAGAQTVQHHFVVPDSTVKIVPYLPAAGEYIPGEDVDRWWHEIAECEGLWLPPEYGSVRFFQVNAIHFYDRDRPSLFWKNGVLMVHWAIGQAYPDEGVIVMSVAHSHEELAVKHEQLHVLLFWNRIPPGPNQHPMPYYGRCGMSVFYGQPKA